MKISVIQMDMKLGDTNYNYLHAQELIQKAILENPDVIVLPETWNTGFMPEKIPTELYDENGKKTTKLMTKLSKKFGVNIVAGSIANRREEKFCNTSMIFGKSGECLAEYDKIHLFSPVNENKYFDAGNRIVTFKIDGILCGIIICYDIRFSELCTKLALENIQILFVVAQWPLNRMFHLNSLALARAIENQIFLVCCNSCGVAGDIKFGGGSKVIDPWGNIIGCANDNESIVSVDIDISMIQKCRSKINVFNDRRPEIYSI